MNKLLPVGLLAAVIAIPVYAQSDATPSKGEMNCPMMADAADMQKQMGAMMGDMRSMMDRMNDPAAKERMQAMHERMNAMMVNMQKMHGGMMQAPPAANEKATEPSETSPPAAGKEDHEAHHPAK